MDIEAVNRIIFLIIMISMISLLIWNFTFFMIFQKHVIYTFSKKYSYIIKSQSYIWFLFYINQDKTFLYEFKNILFII